MKIAVGVPALGLVWLMVWSPVTASAQSLVDLYQAAAGYDAAYQAARKQSDASTAHGEQARAGILPTVNVGAGISQTNQASSYSPYDALNFGTQYAAITATQPLYRPANWAGYAQGNRQIAMAQEQLRLAQQDLIIRVSRAYFDVLSATDTLAVVRSQKAAVGAQLASAKQKFVAGTATVVDTRDAQARFDLVLAQEVASDNDVHVKSLVLNQMVGRADVAPRVVDGASAVVGADLPPEEYWVDQAQLNSPQIHLAQAALDIAELETRKAEAGGRPTVDLVGSYSANNNNGSWMSSTPFTLNQATIGVVLNVPVYAGNAITNQVRESVALHEKARDELEAAQRNVALATRAAYFDLLTAGAQVRAFEAAQASSQSALESNQLGYTVGDKINIDVLNAQSQLFDTRAKLAQARYAVYMGKLRLLQSSGLLQDTDLQNLGASANKVQSRP